MSARGKGRERGNRELSGGKKETERGKRCGKEKGRGKRKNFYISGKRTQYENGM